MTSAPPLVFAVIALGATASDPIDRSLTAHSATNTYAELSASFFFEMDALPSVVISC